VSSILVIAETRRGELRDVTAGSIGAALELKQSAGHPLTVAVPAAEPGGFVADLQLEGVDEIVTVATPNRHFEPHVAEAALEALIARLRPSVVVLSHGADALGFAPAVAARGDHGFASDVIRTGWDGGPIAWRELYGGKLEAELDFPGKQTTILLVRIGAFTPVTARAAAGSVRELALDLPAPRTEHLGFEEPMSSGVDITKADFLLSIGRGVGERANVARLEQLADRLGATLSASRPVIDAGWIDRSRGVGQSGKTVTPAVYLALGISGAGQHLAGIRGAGTIIAVNTDPSAPIFSVADYGAVADLLEVAAALERMAAEAQCEA
jgi:electron transfer flavoprotein alpha subunit